MRRNRPERKPRFCQWMEGPSSTRNSYAKMLCREKPTHKVYADGEYVGMVCDQHAATAHEHGWLVEGIPSNRPQGQKGER